MRQILRLAVLIVGLVLTLTACSPSADRPYEGVEVIPVMLEEAPAEVRAVVEENRARFFQRSLVIGDSTYIVAGYGEKPTAGYSVEFGEALRRDDRVRVVVIYSAPAPGLAVAQVLTYPVTIARLDGRFDVSFEVQGDID